ncbi:MAG: purine-nucleoside phosphorylase [Planctomycetota bacterium]
MKSDSRSAVLDRLQGKATIGIVVGSGMGRLVGSVEVEERVGFHEIPGVPAARVPGHEGELVLGRLASKHVLVQSGRLHYYEGHAMAEVVSLTHLLADLGVRTLIVTSAAGGVSPGLEPGHLMAIEDHINYMGASPLRGLPDDVVGERFCDLTRAYDAGILSLMESCARDLGITLRRGVYMAFCGPSFETPAEIRMAARLGADAVGMSTVPEVIAARARGLRVGALSLITNKAAGLSDKPISHEQTLAVGRRGADNVARLLDALVARL